MILLLQFAMLVFVQMCMIFVYTKPMGRFQVPIVKGMIDYWPVNNPYSGSFHKFGWEMAFCFGFLITFIHVLVVISSFLLTWCSLWSLLLCLFTPAFCFIWHWKLFDEIIGSQVYNNIYYLGGTAKGDTWLHKKYGDRAGEKKDELCSKALFILNILFVILNVWFYAKHI